MNIYSLITKCQLINNLIERSLKSFLDQQTNIGQLHMFMLEPLLDLKQRQDCLDLMLTMRMERILNHPVIIEVLNLVYEGKYTVDTPPLHLSHTFACMQTQPVFEQKRVSDRLVQNIQSFGSSHVQEKRQSSL